MTIPGTTRIEEWPSWDLPVLKWGKSQGAVVGFSHSGWGLKMSDDKLPSYEIPPFDGIGANEYIVDVVHDAVDFISTVDTPGSLGAQYLVPHAQLWVSDQDFRRDRLPLHLRRARRAWAAFTSSSPTASSISTPGAKGSSKAGLMSVMDAAI